MPMKSAPAQRKSPRSYHHGDLRNALMVAALRLIEECGPKGFSLNEAARRAGVSSAAPYRHFADKQALLASVAEEGTLLLAAELQAAAEGSEEPMRKLERAAIAYVAFAGRHRGHFAAMFAGDLDKARFPQLLDASRRSMETMGALVAAVSSRLPASAVPTLTAEIWAITHGVAALVLDGAFDHLLGGLSAEAMAERLVRSRIEAVTTSEGSRPRHNSRKKAA